MIKSLSYPFVEALDRRALFAVIAPDLSFGDEAGLTGPNRDGFVRNDDQHRFIGTSARGILAYTLKYTDRGYAASVQRFTHAGDRDTNFQPIRMDGTVNAAAGSAVDAQGRVIVPSNGKDGGLTLTRYRIRDGRPDASYGSAGSVRIPLPQSPGETFDTITLKASRIAPDGSMYIAFSQATTVDGKRNLTRFRSWLTKVNGDGTFDPSFGGGDGFIRISTDSAARNTQPVRTRYEEEPGFFLDVDAQNRAVVGNRTGNGVFQVQRFLPNGNYDTGFGNKGIATLSPGNDVTFQMAVDAEGRVLVATADFDATITRLNAAGQPDPAFGTNGVVGNLTAGDYQDVGGLVSQSDSKIIVQVSDENGESFVRLNENGTFDTSFDGDGRKEFQYRQGQTRLVALAPDGGLLATLEHPDYHSTISRLAEPDAVELTDTATLYIRGGEADDVVTVTNRPGGGVRVILNGQTIDPEGSFQRIDATLGEGNNSFNSIAFSVPVTVKSGDGNDTITTGNGEDRVETESGNDVITTNGARDEIIFVHGDKTVDSGDGGGYVWTVRLGSAPMPVSNITVRGNGTSDGGTGRWSIDLANAKADIKVGGTRADINAYGNANHVIDLSAMTGEAEVTTGAGNDSIITGAGNDIIFPYAGNDTIRTGAGNDTVWADFELGRPANTASPSNDLVELGAGNDYMVDGYGDNTVFGGDGDDAIVLGPGRDSAAGGLGRDTLRGGRGQDTLDGGGGNDRLFGQDGNDVLYGGNGLDSLVGNNGHDTLAGGLLDDLLVAGNPEQGQTNNYLNTLDGGSGNDTALLENFNDTRTGIERIIESLT